MQLKNHIIRSIKTGELKKGFIIPTEYELCKQFGISRYPVRQAMKELVEEGYLNRTRGRGTFVSDKLPDKVIQEYGNTLGFVSVSSSYGLPAQMLQGFEKQARKRGYPTMLCSFDGTPADESESIRMLADHGVRSIFVFPCDESRLEDELPGYAEKGLLIGLLDRNLDLSGLDYVGSDNLGGAYAAVRHLAIQGYRNVLFVSHDANVSSVVERMEGYMKAVSDFGLNSVQHISIGENPAKYPYPMHRFHMDRFKEELAGLKKFIPLGIFAVNDSIAMQCMKILLSEGITIGHEIGIVGFDNAAECEFAPVPMTSVAQNGLLIGQTAADIAIDKMEGKAETVFRVTVPTQLVVRNSCREMNNESYNI